jgi:phosphatidylserine/phosphatidylglycerophosphate/cardiolipin synthase-like enzyme
MLTVGFDTRSLLNFDPPSLLCLKCGALLPPVNPLGYDWRTTQQRIVGFACPVCNMRYVSKSNWPVEVHVHRAREAMRSEGEYIINFDDPLAHGKRLAAIANRLDRGAPPLDCLIDALNQARQFVHIVSYSLDLVMTGVLGAIKKRVPVRAVLGVCNENVEDEAKKLGLEISIHGKEKYGTIIPPHQKIVVIDGLLAFKGSANLSTSAWHNARGPIRRDLIETATVIDEIRKLNNDYFAPLWMGAPTNWWNFLDEELDYENHLDALPF